MVKIVSSRKVDFDEKDHLSHLAYSLLKGKKPNYKINSRSFGSFDLISMTGLQAISVRTGLNEIDVHRPTFREDALLVADAYEELTTTGEWTLKELYPPKE